MSNKKVSAVLGALFVIDEMMLPVLHVGPVPIKISYLIAALWLLLFLIHTRISGTDISGIIESRESKKIIRNFFLLIGISVVSEFILELFTEVNGHSVLLDGIVELSFCIMCLGVGYMCYKLNPKYLLYVLYAYIIMNIILTIFYTYIPSQIYNFFIHQVDYGDRARGTGGNPNTTLLQMNIVLLAVVLLYRTRKLEISGVHAWLVIIMPLLMNFVVSSRGEFIQTILLEFAYIAYYLRSQKNILKSAIKIIAIIAILSFGYIYVTQVLYYQYDDIKIALDRIRYLSNLTELEDASIKQTSTLARPLIHFDEFWSRFKHSPILGCGYSAGNDYDFLRSADRYHNDIFKILASTGIIGGALWFSSIKKFFKLGGWIVIVPFITTAISNTFIQSLHAINLYFFVFGMLLHCYYDENEVYKDA